MDEAIKNICDALMMEAEAVKAYTEKMHSTSSISGADGAAKVFGLNRLDSTEHIQNLVLELTSLVSADIPNAPKKAGFGDE